jgi:ATP-dependent helicase/nuclease subunit B
MKTIIGPFHPDLEEALADEIRKWKSTDLFAPLLILVPADLIRRRLKILLAREREMPLLNVQFLTFHQLALRLHAEHGGSPLDLKSDLFMEEALRQMIRTRQRGAESFAGIIDRAGGCAALWQTLRDLRDGLVDPTVALEALSEGHFTQRTGERTAELLVLLGTFQQFCRRQKMTDISDINRTATEQVPTSDFLQQFRQIFYYGFYDLTQIQLDFFHAVARHYPVALFFPLLPAHPKHHAWGFAERFYERYVKGRTSELTEPPMSEAPLPAMARLFDSTESRTYADVPKTWQCRIASSFGANDEVAAAAKTILALVDDGEMRFDEIGVLARSLETYAPFIKDIFHQHRIPLAGTLEEPLAQAPLTKAVILFLNLPAKDFLRSQVIDLLSSPFFRLQNIAGKLATPRPDLWDLATRELAICKGTAEWRRLRRFNHRDLELRQLSEDDEPRKIRIGSAQLIFLAEIVETLMTDLLRLPNQASWREYTDTWKALLEKYLGILPNAEMTTGANSDPSTAILRVLDQLAGLDSIQDRVELGDFVHTLQHWLERSSTVEDRRNTNGVMVLSATAARGLSFRALFVLGVNEGVFPRAIREDAFLRDPDREIIELDLGYKLSQKLTAFDEEKLLFTLLIGAARERLYCSYQRADESGRALARSWYIDEIEHALKQTGRPCETIAIPRSITEKAVTAPFDREDLSLPKELAIRLSVQGDDATALVEACGPLPELYKQGRQVVAAIDRSGERLLVYDGALANVESYWKFFSSRGLSPTALETYARCPFQFFARHLLGLAPLDRPEDVLGPTPAEFGELGHTILNSFYRALIDNGYFTGKETKTDSENLLQAVARDAFREYEETNPVGYPLAWETLKDGILNLLRQIVTQDLAELGHSGFVPISLEADVIKPLPPDWPEPLKGLAIRGRLDRIDRKGNSLRVIDYKFKFGASPATADKNLVRAAIRGERLQPPFYYLLAQASVGGEEKSPSDIEAHFYFIAPHWTGGPLITLAYKGESLSGKAGSETKQTIADLADGVRRGRFFINRGEYCGHCDAAPICRKNHPPSLWRAENDPVTAAHRALRDKNLKEDEREPSPD